MKLQPKPLVEKYSARWWKSQLTQAEERRKKFIQAAEESIRVFNAQKQVGILTMQKDDLMFGGIVLILFYLLTILPRQKRK